MFSFEILRGEIGARSARIDPLEHGPCLTAVLSTSIAFSRLLRSNANVYFEFSLALVMLNFVLISHCDYFGFGYDT